MVRSLYPTGALHVTWLGDRFGLWVDDPHAEPRDVRQLAIGIFGPDIRAAAAERFEQHALQESGRSAGIETAAMIPVDPRALCAVLIRARPSSSWSGSLSWLYDATLVAVEIAVTGRFMPTVHTAGLRWRAEWDPLADTSIEAAVDELIIDAPAVLFSAADKPWSAQTMRLLETMVDGLCRFALDEAQWRPPLARTRASSVVALRRITSALSRQDSVFVGDSAVHEAAFAEWATQLSDYRSVTAGAPDVRLRGKLSPPSDAGSTTWIVDFLAASEGGQETSFADIWDGSAESPELGGAAGLTALQTRIRDLFDRLGAQLAIFASLADEAKPSRLELDAGELTELLRDGATICRTAGLTILTPEGFTSVNPRLTATANTSDSDEGWSLRGALVEVDWGLALGDVTLTPEEIDELTRTSAEVISLRGNWVQVDRNHMRASLRALEKQRSEAALLSPAELLRESIGHLSPTSDDDLTAQGWIGDLIAGLPDDELTEAEEPPGFEGELRPYQRRALGWLQFLGRLGLGGCLADDMGLGKTPTALAHILQRTLRRVSGDGPHRPHLVICPLSVVSNWESEANRFTPELQVQIVHGSDRPRGADLIRAAATHDVLITTYGTMSRIIKELAPIEFDVIVCDEAQAIKNHRTNAAVAVRTLQSSQRIGLTGTPVENRLTELWSILDAMNPGMLGGITWFKRTFATPIEDGDGEVLAALRRITAPFVLRRTKADRSLVPDLPDKVEQIAWATLAPEQAGLYQAVLDDFFEKADALSGIERRGIVLATLTRLKQICNHPALFLKQDSVGDQGRSGKLDRFDELVDDLLEAGERAIVFTQYREMGHLLATHLSSRLKHDVPFLHGGTTRKQRTEMVDAFQASDGLPIQLISLRAGGTGLNLTAASRVIHYDRWWNPAVEDQATDRSWRIGQDKTVFVHKMVCQGTLEERIDALLREKRALADAVVGGDESWLTELTTDELRETLRLGSSAVARREEEN